MESAFEGIFKLLSKISHNWISSHGNPIGGNIEDIWDIGIETFLKCLETHKEEESKFSTWFQTKFYFNLLEDKRNRLKHQKIQIDYSIPDKEKKEFQILEFCEQKKLSNSARFVIFLSLTDPEIPPGARNAKKVIREKLMKLGWDSPKISKVFKEIRGKL